MEHFPFKCNLCVVIFVIGCVIQLSKNSNSEVYFGQYQDYIYPLNVKSSYYKEPFHPAVIRTHNGLHYYKPLPPQPREMRIRHLKLDQYMWARRDIDTHISRIVLNHNSWSTFYIHHTVDGSFIEQAYAPTSRQCLSAVTKKGRKLYTDICERINYNERWKLIPNKYGHFQIQKKGSYLCLQPVFDMSIPTLIQLRPCDPYDNQQLWEVSDAYLYY